MKLWTLIRKLQKLEAEGHAGLDVVFDADRSSEVNITVVQGIRGNEHFEQILIKEKD